MLHGSAWGGLSLGVCETLYRKEATQMMVRSGAALMSRNGKGGSLREKLGMRVSWVEDRAKGGR